MANLFDDLVWDASVPGWSGSSTFNGHEIAIDIELDEVDPPSSTELENAKAAVECLYQKLTPTHETELRMATASELTHGAYSQSDYEPTDEDVAKLFQEFGAATKEPPKKRMVNSMTPQSIACANVGVSPRSRIR